VKNSLILASLALGCNHRLDNSLSHDKILSAISKEASVETADGVAQSPQVSHLKNDSLFICPVENLVFKFNKNCFSASVL